MSTYRTQQAKDSRHKHRANFKNRPLTFEEKRREYTSARKSLDELTAEEKSAMVERLPPYLRDVIRTVQSATGLNVSTALAKIDAKRLDRQISDLKAYREGRNREILRLEDELSKRYEGLTDAEVELECARNVKVELQDALKSHKTYMGDLHAKITPGVHDFNVKYELGKARREFGDLSADVRQCNTEINDYRSLVEALYGETELLEHGIESAKAEVNFLDQSIVESQRYKANHTQSGVPSRLKETVARIEKVYGRMHNGRRTNPAALPGIVSALTAAVKPMDGEQERLADITDRLKDINDSSDLARDDYLDNLLYRRINGNGKGYAKQPDVLN